MKAQLAALAGAFASAQALAASQVLPAEPLPFENVNLRMGVDSCTFVPSTVRVNAVSDTLRITQMMNACFAPGTPVTADVLLGAFPVGSYRVEIYAGTDTSVPPAERLAFEVRGLAEPAVFPPPTRPLTDYSGFWWTPAESGWGIALAQNALHGVFGTWYVYDAANRPEWYTFQNGGWTSFTTWSGQIYRSSGPYVGAADFDARTVTIAPVGTVTFDFAVLAGREGQARFTYSLNGQVGTKAIRRF